LPLGQISDLDPSCKAHTTNVVVTLRDLGGKDDQEGAHSWLQGLISNTDATCHFVGGYVPPVG